MKTSQIPLCFLLLFSTFLSAQTVVYVSPNGTGDGSSWANASDIENAITTAPNNSELRLQEGTYNISITLNVTRTLTINGGYTGVGTTRNIVDSSTILDGGGTTQIMRIDRDNVVIDGLEFQRGFVTGSLGGGAIYMTGRTITIRNSRFLNNISSGERGAGAVYIGSQARGAIITDCIFENNRNIFIDYPMGQNGGGAIHNWAPNVAIDNTVFRNNIAENSGGAVYTWGENLQITECNFIENHSDDGGGAIHINYYDVHVTGGSFVNNTATLNGGAISNGRNLSVDRVTFRDNKSEANGGAIYNNHNDATIHFSEFIQNEAERQGGAIYNNFGTLNVALSEFTDNKGLEKGGAIGNNFGQITISQATFKTNNTDGEGGAIYNHRFAKPSIIERSEFRNNTADLGGGIYNYSEEGLQVVSSLFVENEAVDMGGAIFNKRFIRITNSTFVRNTNTALIIPSIRETDNNPAITHVYNSIFYLNTAKTGGYRADIHAEVPDIDQSTQDVRRNITQEYTSTENLIGVNPLFQDFANGDFSLQDNSPAVEYGRNNLFTAVKGNSPATDSDLAGNPRLFDVYVDAGAYELQLNSTLTPPGCTTLTFPVHGATNVAVDTDMSWNAVDDAHGYYISIGTAPGATDIADGLDVGNVTTYTSVTVLDENTTYYVTIVPYNTAGTATGCTEESFTTESLPAAPDCTTITAPADNATDVPLDATITWNSVADATGYYVSIGTTSGGTELVNNEDVSGTSYNPVDDFPENTTIYVSVIPYNAVGNATGCTEISFTTETTTPAPTVPDCTRIISPADGATDVPVDANITWNAVADADGYYVSIGTTLGGTEIVDNADVSGTSYNPVDDFPENTTIYVSVIPYNAMGSATGCTEISFTTETTTVPIVPVCTVISVHQEDNNLNITWEAVSDADEYLVTIGSVSGGDDVFSTVVTGTSFTDQININEETTYYLNIIPQNAAGPAENCEEVRFTTGTWTHIPDCTRIISPADGASDVRVDTDIHWEAVTGADGYYLSAGTTPGETDIVNNAHIIGGNNTAYNLSTALPHHTLIYVTVIPYNAKGLAVRCKEFTFTTEEEVIIPTLPACTAMTYPADGASDVRVDSHIFWNPVKEADGYLISIGTAPGRHDIENRLDIQLSTIYTPAADFPSGAVLYVNIIPYNAAGEAVGCTEESFTTETPDILPDETKYGFSPNGDGINEVWIIHGIENYPDNVVTIYNRWGDRVFQVRGYDNLTRVFDGTANRLTRWGGNRLPSGTYFFRISNLPADHHLKKSAGFLILKR